MTAEKKTKKPAWDPDEYRREYDLAGWAKLKERYGVWDRGGYWMRKMAPKKPQSYDGEWGYDTRGRSTYRPYDGSGWPPQRPGHISLDGSYDADFYDESGRPLRARRV